MYEFVEQSQFISIEHKFHPHTLAQNVRKSSIESVTRLCLFTKIVLV
jgi:hypothetical protein